MGVNQERVALLVEALESGDYEQCEGQLRIDDTFCCLGVACEVAIKNGLDITVTPPGDLSSLFRYDGEASVLPDSVRAWYGFPPELYSADGTANPMIDTEGFGRVTAADANDKCHLPFTAIAAGFRKEYLTEA